MKNFLYDEVFDWSLFLLSVFMFFFCFVDSAVRLSCLAIYYFNSSISMENPISIRAQICLLLVQQQNTILLKKKKSKTQSEKKVLFFSATGILCMIRCNALKKALSSLLFGEIHKTVFGGGAFVQILD